MGTVSCPACGEPNPEQRSVCSECGADLGEGTESGPAAPLGQALAGSEAGRAADEYEDKAEPSVTSDEQSVPRGDEPLPEGDQTEGPQASPEPPEEVPDDDGVADVGFRPMEGIEGGLPLETVMALPRRSEPSPPPGPPESDIQEAELIRRMLSEEAVSEEPVAVGSLPDRLAGPGRPMRLMICVVLLAAVVAGLVWHPDWVGGRVQPSLPARDLFQTIELLPPNSTVLLGFDYDPGTAGELTPLAQAVLDHLTRRRIRLLVVSTLATGIPTAGSLIDDVALTREMVYGADYVVLGYLPGEEIGLRQMGGALTAPFVTDYYLRRPLGEFEIMRGISDIRQVGLVIDLAAEAESVKRWIEQIQSPYRVPMVALTSAAAGPRVAPYYASGQLRGTASGLGGAAEYETLLARPGKGIATAQAQAFAYLAIVVLILLGNLVYLNERSKVTRDA